MKTTNASSQTLEQLTQLSTCVVASAIETFKVRMRNTGFTDASIHCMFPESSPLAGYAATARVRSSDPPMDGHNYYERPEFWNYIESIPAPRIVIIQDMDRPPGLGAFVGEVQGNILKALGCIGLVTNGGVRDLPELHAIGFRPFSGCVSVSHAYAHVFDIGSKVEIGGLQVRPGELVHADMHGVQTIPHEISDEVPAAAWRILQTRKRLTDLCQSDKFSVDRLRETMKGSGL